MTQNQSIVVSALHSLKFAGVQPKEPRVGGPMQFEVTDDVIALLTSLQESKTFLVVDSSGDLAIEEKVKTE